MEQRCYFPNPPALVDAIVIMKTHSQTYAPWGLAEVDNELWVSNFGDGLINVYDPMTGAFVETFMRADGTPFQFDGLWDLLPQAGGVFFTAGIADEEHGLFGIITEDQP